VTTKVATLWRKYVVLIGIEWSVMLAYRSESLIWMVSAFVQPLVSLAIWLSISTDMGPLNGYLQDDYIRYFLGVLLVVRLTQSWDVWELDREIREGTLSAKLLRPFHPIHWSLAQNLVYNLFFAALIVPAWCVLAFFIPSARLPVSLIDLLVATVTIGFASGIRFLIGYQVGLLAFWTNRATSIYMLYEGVHLFLAGRLAPLAMFPDWVQRIGKVLPFYLTIGFPVELLTGKIHIYSREALFGIGLQVLWFMVLLVLFRVIWRKGLKQYGAVGG
jgi:ABC-2 type transport system permease protein